MDQGQRRCRLKLYVPGTLEWIINLVATSGALVLRISGSGIFSSEVVESGGAGEGGVGGANKTSMPW